MVKVSVVIPVYNVEEFLNECLDSIVHQTLEDIEIICVNDGSKDKSLDILNLYAKNDDRITVISQENGGHAVATNRGMGLAKGEYLYLMDSDDILELTALEETYNYAKEKDADFILFQSLNYDMDEDKYYKTDIYSMEHIADFVGDSVFNYNDLDEMIFDIPVTPWSKLYKNQFIKDIDEEQNVIPSKILSHSNEDNMNTYGKENKFSGYVCCLHKSFRALLRRHCSRFRHRYLYRQPPCFPRYKYSFLALSLSVYQ